MGVSQIHKYRSILTYQFIDDSARPQYFTEYLIDG